MIKEQFETFKHTYLHRIALKKVVDNLFDKVKTKKLVFENKYDWIYLVDDVHSILEYHDMDKMVNYF